MSTKMRKRFFLMFTPESLVASGLPPTVGPLVCPRCGSQMRVLAVIADPAEVMKILRHLVQIGRPPPGLDTSLLN
jgi:hypothetical protein